MTLIPTMELMVLLLLQYILFSLVSFDCLFEQRDSKSKMLHYLYAYLEDVTDLYRETVIEIKEMMNNISHKKA